MSGGRVVADCADDRHVCAQDESLETRSDPFRPSIEIPEDDGQEKHSSKVEKTGERRIRVDRPEDAQSMPKQKRINLPKELLLKCDSL